MLQALRVGSRPSWGQGWAGAAQWHRSRLGGEVCPPVSLPQQSLPHATPLLLLSIISFLLAVFTGACCSKHDFTVPGCHCSATGRFSSSIIFPLNTSKATEKHLVNIFTSSEKKPQNSKPQNKTEQNQQQTTRKFREINP